MADDGDFMGDFTTDDDDMTAAQRMASVISPDIDTSTGPETPDHPDIDSQPPVAQPAVSTPAASSPDMTPNAPLAPTDVTTDAMIAQPNFVPEAFSSMAGGQLGSTPDDSPDAPDATSPAAKMLASVGPAPQYDTATLQKLQAQQSADSVPNNPNDPQFKAGIGTKIRRGLAGWFSGGPAGALDANYNAPNRQYGIAEAMRQGRLKQDTQDISSLDKSNEEQTKNYTSKLNLAKEGITLQKNDETEAAREQRNQTTSELNDVREKLLDTKQKMLDAGIENLPKTYEAATIAAHLEKDPARKAALQGAVSDMQEFERKKFQYANKQQGGGNDSVRQSLIDKATNDIQSLQDDYDFDPETNSYTSKKNPAKQITPEEYTDEKNKIATKLDQQLTAKKKAPLNVRFDPNDARGSQYKGQRTGPAGTAPTPNRPAATATTFTVQDGGGKQLTDKALAQQYIQKAGGDKAKARQLAAKDNWKF